MPREAFNCDYLTEIYLTVKQKNDVYTDAYNDHIDSLEDEMEETTELAAAERYTKLIAEAQEKIDDAQTELDDKSKEAEEELADAWQQISDGETFPAVSAAWRHDTAPQASSPALHSAALPALSAPAPVHPACPWPA